MKEITGNIWDYHRQGHWIVITTNGTVRNNGEAVMGRGVAREASEKFQKLSLELGNRIKGCNMAYGEWSQGNNLKVFYKYKIITFPVKYNWWERASLALIEKSCKELKEACHGNIDIKYMVRPGCGNGQLLWLDVKPILEKYLDDRFIIVERK